MRATRTLVGPFAAEAVVHATELRRVLEREGRPVAAVPRPPTGRGLVRDRGRPAPGPSRSTRRGRTRSVSRRHSPSEARACRSTSRTSRCTTSTRGRVPADSRRRSRVRLAKGNGASACSRFARCAPSARTRGVLRIAVHAEPQRGRRRRGHRDASQCRDRIAHHARQARNGHARDRQGEHRVATVGADDDLRAAAGCGRASRARRRRRPRPSRRGPDHHRRGRQAVCRDVRTRRVDRSRACPRSAGGSRRARSDAGGARCRPRAARG